MSARAWFRLGIGAIVVAAAGGQPREARAQASVASPCAGLTAIADARVGSPDLPLQRSFRYRMAGRVRPLLFWVSRDGVGSGQIAWRGSGSGAVAYELLIGTDPAHAPRAINRWGYIVEEVHPEETHVFGVISTDEEATLRDVNRGLDKGQVRGRFKAIEARITSAGSCSATGTIETERELTLRDAPELAQQVRNRLARVTPKGTAVPAGVRPGFLTAVAEVVGETVQARRAAGPAALRRMRGHTVKYVYGDNLLDLVLMDAEPAPTVPPKSDSGQFPVHATFEVRLPVTGERYRFELQYPTEGEMAGVPSLIRYKPRWWLQVELVLDASKGQPTAVVPAQPHDSLARLTAR